MKFSPMPERSLIKISGEDAEHFLDNLITCKVVGLETGQASFGALLTPQGKIMFDFFLVKQSDSYLIDVISYLAEDLVKRLTFYRLRAKVTLELIPQAKVFAIWDTNNTPEDLQINDPRLSAMGLRDYSGNEPQGEAADYNVHRLANGMPQGGSDFQYGDGYPHEVQMDQFGGVDFKKGCYVGQEVVSRMQHRGTTKKRIIMVEGETDLPASGTAIAADEKPAGTLGTAIAKTGLALLRLDRIAKAQSIMAGDTQIKFSLQEWVNFEMPGKE